MFRNFVALMFLLDLFDSGTCAGPSVLVIGAGPAGVAAATRLVENGITNVTILEAENRIGGRIHSVKFVDGIVDLGACCCYGEKNNVVYERAKRYKILAPMELSQGNRVYYSNGSKLDVSAGRNLDALIFSYCKDNNIGYNTAGKSVGDVFIERYNSTVLKQFEDNIRLKKMYKEHLVYSEGIVTHFEGWNSWFDASAEKKFKFCDDTPFLIWKGVGFKTILEILMKTYPDSKQKSILDGKIYFNKKVTKIDWSNDQSTIVLTSDGTIYTSDYVIFTPSLGVLKEQKDTLFAPPLPLSKQKAIENTGFSSLMKIIVHFPIKWWNDEDTIFFFFWGEEDLNDVDFRDGPFKDGMSWIVQIRDMTKETDNANVWVIWISGDLVPEIEQLSTSTLKAGVRHVLNKFLGKAYNVTEIGETLQSTWCSNENFRGTTSYIKKGLYQPNLSYQEILAEPLTNRAGSPKVLFAGEATHPTDLSTTHGALETGFREAERIVKLEL